MASFEWPDPPSQYAMPIEKAGLPMVFAAAFATAVVALVGIVWLALVGLLITFAIALFFRDPDRVVPNVEGAIVSPADGKVIRIDTLQTSKFITQPCQKISIFMNVFNVHINRTPAAGEITEVQYQTGKFIPADKDDAVHANEHNAVFLKTPKGQTVCFVQIAGLIARRIICKVQPGDILKRGQRFGLICFGSRVDVYLPLQTSIEVQRGDKVKAGVSIIGSFQE